MKRLQKFLSLTTSDRLLLVKTLLLIGTIKLGLWLLPFPTLQGFLAKRSQPNTQSKEIVPIYLDRVVWAVRATSRLVPGAKCLEQAMATKALLHCHGYSTRLYIGVAKGEGKILAHAWLESHGKIIIGNLPNLSTFTVMSLVGGQR